MFDSNSFHSLVAPFDGSTGVYLYVDENRTDDLEASGFWLASPAVPGDYVISRGHPERSSAIYLMGDDGTAVLAQRIRTDMINAVAPALAVLANANAGGVDVFWDDVQGKPDFIAAGSDADEARAAIGAGTSNLEIGTTATTAMAGNTAIPPATTPGDITQAMANKAEIAALVSPAEDYADLTEATAAIRSVIDALQA